MRLDQGNDDYSPSDSDEEYTENEKILINKVRNRNKDHLNEEEEIYGVGTDNSDESEDLAASDIEGQEDDDLPDVRAWGKDKRKFYQTDYVDADYGGYQGKDAHLAEFEEEEARNLQKQLAESLDDADFALDIFSVQATKDKETEDEEIIKTDISKLSKRQKLEIMKKESPEFFSLVDDFQSKLSIAKDFFYPILKKFENGEISQCSALDFVQTHYELILNYCTNIYMYLLLKSSKANIQNHPLIKRLYQYRQFLLQLEPVFEEIIKPQIEILLNQEKTNLDNIVDKEKKKKKLQLLSNLAKKTVETKKRKLEEKPVTERVKKVKFIEEIATQENDVEDLKVFEELENEIEEDEEEPSKRAITYKMAKNKGLTPHRKKEQRNPRVKHKLKYRKAIIRRKGAVREPRTELSRYGGEISGIKATVSRSVKIKS